MKKIAIFTMRSKNYGNRLQNYALQKYIEKLGYSCVTLQDKTVNMKVEDILKRHGGLKKLKWLIRFYAKHMKMIKKTLGKIDGFDLFDFKYINEAKDWVSSFEISDNIEKKYDVFIAGSDQIWNTSFGFVTVNYFLPFEHPNKIAYSASFGIEDINVDNQIIDSLNKFNKISVREEAGVKIVYKLTGRKAEVLIDPTLLITAEEWRSIENKPNGAIESGYILTYFLSEKSEEAKMEVENIRQEKKVYELMNSNDNVTRGAGPTEFLWLFNHAELILTDSFHACVFAFLFNKPFLVFDRNWNGGNMNTRLETLLSKFSLERKYYASGLDNQLMEHDYRLGYEQLEIERKKANEFLKNAIEN